MQTVKLKKTRSWYCFQQVQLYIVDISVAAPVDIIIGVWCMVLITTASVYIRHHTYYIAVARKRQARVSCMVIEIYGPVLCIWS